MPIANFSLRKDFISRSLSSLYYSKNVFAAVALHSLPPVALYSSFFFDRYKLYEGSVSDTVLFNIRHDLLSRNGC